MLSPLMQPVIEVIAEIGFATPDGAKLPDTAGLHLFGRLKRRYPIYERATDVQLQVEMHDDIDAIEARCDRVSHRFLYRTNPPAVVVQLSSAALQLHFVGPYAGWNMIQDIIEREWTTTAQTLQLRLGAFVALRYLCHLPLTPARQSLAYWLKKNAFMPEAMRHKNRGYQSRVELTDAATDLVTSIGIAPVDVLIPSALEIKPIGLDVALRQELTHRIVRKSATGCMQGLYTHVQSIFAEMLSGEARRHLQLDCAATVNSA